MELAIFERNLASRNTRFLLALVFVVLYVLIAKGAIGHFLLGLTSIMFIRRGFEYEDSIARHRAVKDHFTYSSNIPAYMAYGMLLFGIYCMVMALIGLSVNPQEEALAMVKLLYGIYMVAASTYRIKF